MDWSGVATVLLGIIGTLIVVFLKLIHGRLREISATVALKVDEKTLLACQQGCQKEISELWSRTNRHSHTPTGKVVIEEHA